MSSVEINYFIPELSKNGADFEAIVAAIGAYEAESEESFVGIQQTAELQQQDDTVSIKLARTTLRSLKYSEALRVAGRMRVGVESYFPPKDRRRLSELFIGVSSDSVDGADI
jgi:hypothetical protein